MPKLTKDDIALPLSFLSRMYAMDARRADTMLDAIGIAPHPAVALVESLSSWIAGLDAQGVR